MRELIGRYHDAVERYLRLKLRDQNLADEVFQEFWTKLLTHKLAGADQQQGPVPRLPPDGPPPPDHRPLPGPEAPAAPPRRPARPLQPRRRLRPRLARGRHQARLVAARDLRGQHPQEPLRHASSTSASTTPRPRSRSSPQQLGEQTRRQGHARGVPQDPPARPRQVPGAADPGAPRDHPPAEPEDIEAEIFDLGLGHLYRRYSAESDD